MEVEKVGHCRYLVFDEGRKKSFLVNGKYDTCSCKRRDCEHKAEVTKFVVEKNLDKVGVSVIDPPDEFDF